MFNLIDPVFTNNNTIESGVVEFDLMSCVEKYKLETPHSKLLKRVVPEILIHRGYWNEIEFKKKGLSEENEEAIETLLRRIRSSIRYEIEKKLSLDSLERYEAPTMVFSRKIMKNYNAILKDISFQSLSSLRARVILNNCPRPGLDIGDWDKVGYILVGVNTGTLVPVARNDEHHAGMEFCAYLKENNLIPDDSYYPLYLQGDYFPSHPEDFMVFIKACKTWVKNKGPNILISDRSRGEPLRVGIYDIAKKYRDMETLYTPVGSLSVISKLIIKFLVDSREVIEREIKTNNYNIKRIELLREKFVLKLEPFLLANIVEPALIGFFDKIREFKNINIENPRDVENLIFSFDGIKNQLHTALKVTIEENNPYTVKGFDEIFGSSKDLLKALDAIS